MAIFQNTAKPGTELFGVDLSYKNAEEINEIISQRIEEFIKNPQEIIVEGRRLKIPLKEVNLEISMSETLSQIEYITLNKAGLADVFGNLNASKKINPYICIDEELLIQKLKKEIGAESVQNANIEIDPHAGLSVVEGKSGLEIKTPKLLSDVHKNLLGLKSQPITVETFIKEPDVKAEDLSAQLKDIEKKLTDTKTLIFEDEEF
ncbi:MAG: peptidoglycan binding domain-containing protein, partial [Patescibacteria group bacterium]